MPKNILRKIGFVLLALLSAVIISGVTKNILIDTPRNSLNKNHAALLLLQNNDVQTNVFKINKTYVYKIYYWSLLPLGELKFATKAREGGVVFSFGADTKGCWMSRFIKAKAHLESFFLANNSLPYRYSEVTDVDGKKKVKEIVYDHQMLIATRNEYKYDHEKLVADRGEYKFKIPPDTYDPVAAFAYMLTLPFDKEKEQKVKFVSGRDVFILKAVVVGEKAGIYDILIDMRREDQTSTHGATFQVWVTADQARVPLAFKSWSPVGFASVVLDRIEYK